MSYEYIRKYSSACNKRRFLTRKDAKRVMKKANKMGRKSEKRPANIYWCDTCDAFHLTSIPKSEWRGKK